MNFATVWRSTGFKLHSGLEVIDGMPVSHVMDIMAKESVTFVLCNTLRLRCSV